MPLVRIAKYSLAAVAWYLTMASTQQMVCTRDIITNMSNVLEGAVAIAYKNSL